MDGNTAPVNGAPPSDYTRFDDRVQSLLSRMTLREKIGQLIQHNIHQQPSEVQRDLVKQGMIGSFLNAIGAQRNELQRIAVEQTRLGIPLIFGRDVIHGFRTIFPIPIAQASSFNPELVRQTARAAGGEAASQGVDWTFAPMVDITRDPRWGRIAECCGEDPYLAGKLGAAMVRGFQGDDLTAQDSVAACAKHFVGYGATEAGKDYNTTYIPEQLLRELYLPPFKACIEAGAATLMSAFNDLNGVPASGNAHTLRRILRDEWGFSGFVVSDWASLWEMISHGYCETNRDAARAGLRAGVDMEMASNTYVEHLESLVQSGEISEQQIDECVRNVLRVKFACGLFEQPYRELDDTKLLAHEHLELAQRAAIESTVLLKNAGARLPLKRSARVAVVGALADSGIDQLGCWAFDGRAADAVTPLAALRSLLGPDNVVYARGLEKPRSTSQAEFDEAVRAARSAEVCVAFVGEDMALSGEARCRAFLDLPGAQRELVDALAATGTPLVLVVMSGRPLTMGASIAKADAVLWAWHGGTMAGPAIAELLFGIATPSGKLPVSIPRTVGQIPVYYGKKNTGRPPKSNESGIPLGSPLDPKDFCSMHMDVEQSPEFPFGFGLSYASFEYRALELSSPELRATDSLCVSVEIENTGSVKAIEVAQLYLRDLVASITRPIRELKGFERVELAPGEKRRVEFTLTPDDLAFVGPELKRIVEPGKFQLWVGGSSLATLTASFHVV